MARFANKTFFKFLFGFIIIVLISFLAIVGTTKLAEENVKNNTASLECAEGEEC